MCTDRVHEEMREFTQQPLQKIIAPLRNVSIFGRGSKSKVVSLAGNGSSAPPMELAPLVADNGAHSSHATAAQAASHGTRSHDNNGAGSNASSSAALPQAHVATDAGDRTLSASTLSGTLRGGSEAQGPPGQLQTQSSNAELQGLARLSGANGQPASKAGLRIPAKKLPQHVD